MIATLLCLAPAGPSEAKGIRDKFKKAFGKDEQDQEPKTGVAAAAPEQPSAANAAGVRDVLLVSVPMHAAEIVEGSTIAFIDFDHIATEILFSFTERRVAAGGGEGETFRDDAYARIDDERFESEICARQVESALAQHLADLNRYKVVTREHIATVLKEQRFANSGSADSATAVKLGELIGADVLIYGQVQLCVSSARDYEALANLAFQTGSSVTGEAGGWLGNMLNAFKTFKPEQLRAFVLAQIQLISAETGKRIFTTSLMGEFEAKKNALSFEIGHRELIYRAADDLANGFIDDFLARREALYVNLYADDAWEFGTGIDLIQLGDCLRAEQHFRDVYSRNRWSMAEKDVAKLMYNHGIALMCSNRSEEALDRLWASLRLVNESRTFEAIAFTNDVLDRGRNITSEEDPIVRDVEHKLYPAPAASESSP
jgi:hypothetical protein